MKEIFTDDVTYYVGKNIKENDKLYNEMPENSIWFHLDNEPSSHVYAISHSEIKKKDLKKGAMLVRENSKGQGRVVYVERKNIKLIGPGLIDILKEAKYL
jgi:predicted ribosome quality control (RQC) complex YloA/Tae2 family protein